MTWPEAVLVFVAGVGAGTINAVVGSGTLMTFPALLAAGLPPVLANVSNTVGLVPGTLASAIGYRRELAGQRQRALRLIPASLIGTITGALLLLRLPGSAFKAIVPVLILLGCTLVVLLAGVYGGYFGAAQGVLLMAILGIGLDTDLQKMNAVKNVLAFVVNGSAAVLFVLVSDVNWAAAGLVAIGSTIGGALGSTVGRRLPPVALRGIIVVVGVTAAITLLG